MCACTKNLFIVVDDGGPVAHGQVRVLPQLLHPLAFLGRLDLILKVTPRVRDPSEGVPDLVSHLHLDVRVGPAEHTV